MSKKIKDIVATVGSYTQNGVLKKRFKTVGAVFQQDDGGMYLMIDRSFNPAGVPFKDGSESILLSLYDPKPANGQQPTKQSTKQPVEDDIAF